MFRFQNILQQVHPSTPENSVTLRLSRSKNLKQGDFSRRLSGKPLLHLPPYSFFALTLPPDRGSAALQMPHQSHTHFRKVQTSTVVFQYIASIRKIWREIQIYGSEEEVHLSQRPSALLLSHGLGAVGKSNRVALHWLSTAQITLTADFFVAWHLLLFHLTYCCRSESPVSLSTFILVAKMLFCDVLQPYPSVKHIRSSCASLQQQHTRGTVLLVSVAVCLKCAFSIFVGSPFNLVS